MLTSKENHDVGVSSQMTYSWMTCYSMQSMVSQHTGVFALTSKHLKLSSPLHRPFRGPHLAFTHVLNVARATVNAATIVFENCIVKRESVGGEMNLS